MTERPELLWGLGDQEIRPPLTVTRVAAAGIALADEVGLAAVSMRQVAGRLGVTKMALYRHVVSKAELVAVMIEIAVGAPPDLSTTQGWRPKLTEWAGLMRETWQLHPWLPAATVGERAMGPREIGWTEAAVAALADTGLSGGQRLDAVFLLSGHIRNTRSTATAGTQPWNRDKSLRRQIADHGDRFPALVAATDEAHGDDSSWEFGLARIFDGLALLIAAS
ncbi:TetR/AcrR family transcriptional regulator [Kutzneria sp. CA-103260]|uniref:TetR/AcrR family transcriptional regulator n=1 Tax=Kutzneria sp. CA-103260 TaxID=2802641 RepID=UPI001BA50FDC|nr:TetR/AcrR family transcriptional regulator C-terminal domain-containing protein [Kutzneria sp. CA-103260]QUQ66486.1 TetR family transcriptional regulator [Kutzneria sp. CA-103260]